jgi:hypothetical protein
MTGRSPTAAEIAQRETSAAAGIAQAILQEQNAACIACGCTDRHACAGGCYWLRLDRGRGVGVCSACQPYTAAWDAARAFGPPHLDLVAHLHRQRLFSERTFGPGPRTAGVVAHIRKELAEIEAQPADLMEWIDVVMLALDGAWRAGHEPAAIALALATKLTKNELRTWPDWRTAAPDTAIEHVREAAE